MATVSGRRRFHLVQSLALAASVLAFAGCGGAGSSSETPATTAPEERPGSAVVYDRIASLTDCTKLQAEFDQADENHGIQSAEGDLTMMRVSSSYMDAADDRMREIGCYR